MDLHGNRTGTRAEALTTLRRGSILPKIYVPEGLDAKDPVITDRDLFHYIVRVMRLGVGDEIDLFDGSQRCSRMRIDSVGDRMLSLSVVEERRPSGEPEHRIVLAQGLSKGRKLDLVVQKATEIGVHRIVPFISSRAVPRVSGRGFSGKEERWRRIAVEAARQSGRARVPEVSDVVDYADLWEDGSFGARTLVLWEEEAIALREVDPASLAGGEISLVVGPEGGLSGEEIDAARSHGAKTFSLGDRILRTETAGIVGLSLVLFMLGDLG